MPGDLPPPDPSQRNRYEAEPQPPAPPASYDQLRRVLLALGAVAMVVFAIGLGLIVLRDDDDGAQPSGGSGTTSPSASGVAPAATTNPAAGASTTAPTVPSSSATTGVPASSLAPGSSVSPGASAPPTPGASGPPTPGASAPPTPGASAPPAPGASAPPAPGASAPPAPGAAGTPPTTGAAGTNGPAAVADPGGVVATAEALLDAFAEGRWNDARVLNPGRNESDDFLQSAYGPIEDATVIPAAVTAVGGGRYDLRFGIVAHENQPTGRQTVLMCSHWQVDVETKTVLRLESARIRVEGGYVDPSSRAGELSSVCAPASK